MTEAEAQALIDGWKASGHLYVPEDFSTDRFKRIDLKVGVGTPTAYGQPAYVSKEMLAFPVAFATWVRSELENLQSVRQDLLDRGLGPEKYIR